MGIGEEDSIGGDNGSVLLNREGLRLKKPQFTHVHCTLLFRAYVSNEIDPIPVQSLWYQLLHLSHAMQFPNLTDRLHSPHGNFTDGGPGLSSILLLMMRRTWISIEQGFGGGTEQCFRWYEMDKKISCSCGMFDENNIDVGFCWYG